MFLYDAYRVTDFFEGLDVEANLDFSRDDDGVLKTSYFVGNRPVSKFHYKVAFGEHSKKDVDDIVLMVSEALNISKDEVISALSNEKDLESHLFMSIVRDDGAVRLISDSFSSNPEVELVVDGEFDFFGKYKSYVKIRAQSHCFEIPLSKILKAWYKPTLSNSYNNGVLEIIINDLQ